MLQCSCRTVYRDLNLLRKSGIAVRFDVAHAAYSTEILPEAVWDENALAALIVAAIHSPLVKREGVGQHISASLQAIAGRASPQLRESVADLLRSLVDDHGAMSQEDCRCWLNGEGQELHLQQTAAL